MNPNQRPRCGAPQPHLIKKPQHNTHTQTNIQRAHTKRLWRALLPGDCEPLKRAALSPVSPKGPGQGVLSKRFPRPNASDRAQKSAIPLTGGQSHSPKRHGSEGCVTGHGRQRAFKTGRTSVTPGEMQGPNGNSRSERPRRATAAPAEDTWCAKKEPARGPSGRPGCC